MERNQSHPAEFILCGLLYHSKFDVPLFYLFTLTYLLSLIGNLTIIVTISLSSSLQTPMYFFLTNLSILDICCISTTVPKMLYNFILGSYTITFHACAIQLYLFSWIEITELLLLTYMAFDRYIAICKPLHYTLIITQRVCFQAVITVWTVGAFSSGVHTSATFSLSFCDKLEINHFFCEIPPLLKLSCTDTTLNEMLTLLTDVLFGFWCFIFISVSYFFILSSIAHIHSAEGKKKAASTCTSHIIVVLIFYGTLFIAYVKPQSEIFSNQDKILSVIYVVFVPLLNPLIYTLRNKDMTQAILKVVSKITVSAV
ncbi:olfactory receptor 5I1-like [Bufo gargarizans]|uniref:olfactory receptor 5I1-like n=1 Tax=Bufo gargarizans TaxID=30331 RepID=UPI001CF416E4|nr:olfactory receptor 5I1-like [Bufo gargarizans]